ncbi:MAG: FAD:protein FMN transferase, partial [Clostridia bacterium]|nr:FAD:protein FMN transferase [Clostridia bacterium]
MMKRAAAFFLLLALLLSFAACAPMDRTLRGFSMGSSYSVTYCFDGDLDSEIAALFDSVESEYSVRVDGSLISRINAAATHEAIALSPSEGALLTRIFSISDESQGAFDPAILPLVRLWGFDPPYEMNGEVPPTDAAISVARAISTLDHFAFSADGATLVKQSLGAALDLGA